MCYLGHLSLGNPGFESGLPSAGVMIKSNATQHTDQGHHSIIITPNDRFIPPCWLFRLTLCDPHVDSTRLVPNLYPQRCVAPHPELGMSAFVNPGSGFTFLARPRHATPTTTKTIKPARLTTRFPRLFFLSYHTRLGLLQASMFVLVH